MTVRTIETASEALRIFAEYLDAHRPSSVQLKTGNEMFNKGAVNALEWAARSAREFADKLEMNR
jgi:hypothetical protein